MTDQSEPAGKLKQYEWLIVFLFLTILASLVAIAYLSDSKIDEEVERYMNFSDKEKILKTKRKKLSRKGFL